MRISYGKLAFAALLLTAGCAATPQTAGRGGRDASYRLATANGGEPDAYGHPRGPNERGYVTGTLVPETPAEQRNDPNRLGSARVYDRDDLLRVGGGSTPGDSLSRIDPDFAISGRR